MQFWDAYGDVYDFDGDYPYLDTGADNQFILDQICYKGQEGSVYDWDAGMLYCQNRYYIGNGRWLTRDPTGLDGGLNVYEFCGNNPLVFSDPAGTDLHIAGLTSGAATWAFLWHGPANLNSPSHRDAMRALIRTEEERALFFGHGTVGSFPLGDKDDSSIIADDLIFCAKMRKAFGLPKLKLLEFDACMVMADHDFVNAALDVADEVKGYKGWTVNPEFPHSPGILWSFKHKLTPGVREPDSDDNYVWGHKPGNNDKKYKKKHRKGIE
jgi:RHS repeat-associated protein